MKRNMLFSYLKVALLSLIVDNVLGQGRMVSPAGRSSMWRLGFDTPINENDNALSCGGNKRRWEKNGGKCGVCGDPWDAVPRANEAGGRYATGVISKHYPVGAIVRVTIDLAVESGGYFEFRLCANNNFSSAVTHECFDNGLLFLGDGKSTTYENVKCGLNEVDIKLPGGLECQQCVLQWKYHTDEMYGCENEPRFTEYYACADISIYNTHSRNSGNSNNRHFTKRPKRQIMAGERQFEFDHVTQYVPRNGVQNTHTFNKRPTSTFNPPNTFWSWTNEQFNPNVNDASRSRRRTQQSTNSAQMQMANPHLNGMVSSTMISGGRVRTKFNRRRKGRITDLSGNMQSMAIPTEPTNIRSHSSSSFNENINGFRTFSSNSNPTRSRQVTFQQVSQSRPRLIDQSERSRIHREFLDPMSANLGHTELTVQQTVTQKVLRGASHATPTRQCEYCPFDECLDDKLRLDYLFPGLFDSPTKFFECKRYERLFTLGNYDVIQEGLPDCSHPRFRRQLNRFDDDDVGCCTTRPQVILPLTVESDNDTFTVVQLGDSKKQFIVQGICGRGNTTSCTVCSAENNFQWVLVYDPRVNTNPPVSFVPVKFPHYCRCYNHMIMKG